MCNFLWWCWLAYRKRTHTLTHFPGNCAFHWMEYIRVIKRKEFTAHSQAHSQRVHALQQTHDKKKNPFPSIFLSSHTHTTINISKWKYFQEISYHNLCLNIHTTNKSYLNYEHSLYIKNTHTHTWWIFEIFVKTIFLCSTIGYNQLWLFSHSLIKI